MSLVSIIVPVYNSAKYLSSCIDSILQQVYSSIELVLVNDGSTDTSLAICESYAKKDSRIIVIDQKNAGVSAARNIGLDVAKGDYIFFVDSDDELYPEAVSLLMNDIKAFNADIASGLKRRVLEGCLYETRETCENSNAVLYEGTAALDLALKGKSQSACARLIKRSLIKDIRFLEGRKVNEDGFFMFECYTKLPRVVERNEYVYKYYVRENSASRSAFSEKYLDVLYFLERKKDIINNNFPELKDNLINLEVRTHLGFLQLLCRTTDKKYKALQLDSIKIVKAHALDFDKENAFERRLTWIVAHGLYPIYKRLVWLKYYR